MTEVKTKESLRVKNSSKKKRNSKVYWQRVRNERCEEVSLLVKSSEVRRNWAQRVNEAVRRTTSPRYTESGIPTEIMASRKTGETAANAERAKAVSRSPFSNTVRRAVFERPEDLIK